MTWTHRLPSPPVAVVLLRPGEREHLVQLWIIHVVANYPVVFRKKTLARRETEQKMMESPP